MALYGCDGRLIWYRSQHFGSVPTLRRAARSVLADTVNLSWLITEGDVRLGAVWERIAMRQGVRVQRVSAETWRADLLDPSHQRDSSTLRKSVDTVARRIIAWSGAPAPTALSSDAADAILIGFWGVTALGWVTKMPVALRQPLRQALRHVALR